MTPAATFRRRVRKVEPTAMEMGHLNYPDWSVATPGVWRLSSFSSSSEVEREDEVSLASVWRTLSKGSWRALDAFAGPYWEYLLVGGGVDRGRSRLAPRPRDLAMVRRALQGQTLKAIAIELGLEGRSLSTALGDMHLDVGPRTGSLFLAAAAFAHYEQRFAATARVRSVTLGEGVYRLYGIRRPELVLAGILDREEIELARMTVEGRSAAAIARGIWATELAVMQRLHHICARIGVTTRQALLSKVLESAFPIWRNAT